MGQKCSHFIVKSELELRVNVLGKKHVYRKLRKVYTGSVALRNYVCLITNE